MTALEELASTLLYEGYALYPYTPGATKNATPTPFGIVYPPAYAAGSGATFDHIQLQCLLRSEEEPEVAVEVLFLQAAGERHTALERRVGPGDFAFDDVAGRVTVAVEPHEEGVWRTTARVENTSRAPAGLARAEALQRSLLSTHVVVRARGGHFVSPLEAGGCENVNTWPVLAAADDTAVLGAAIILPDHPQIAPQSRGALFDNTEIEEALRLHVLTLTDAERESIEATQDPAVREMVQAALSTTAEDLMALHGMMRPVDKDPRDGEDDAMLDGIPVRRGTKLALRLGDRIDPYDRMLDGRTATLERIYVDVEGRTYLGVTVDSDPMQEVMRETGRYLFFFAEEVEVVAEGANERGEHTMGEGEHEGGKPPAPFEEGAGDKGLGAESGGLDGPGGPSDVTERMPEARGEVVYADQEDPDKQRPDTVPQEGVTTDDADTGKDASRGADNE